MLYGILLTAYIIKRIDDPFVQVYAVLVDSRTSARQRLIRRASNMLNGCYRRREWNRRQLKCWSHTSSHIGVVTLKATMPPIGIISRLLWLSFILLHTHECLNTIWCYASVSHTCSSYMCISKHKHIQIIKPCKPYDPTIIFRVPLALRHGTAIDSMGVFSHSIRMQYPRSFLRGVAEPVTATKCP